MSNWESKKFAVTGPAGDCGNCPEPEFQIDEFAELRSGALLVLNAVVFLIGLAVVPFVNVLVLLLSAQYTWFIVYIWNIENSRSKGGSPAATEKSNLSTTVSVKADHPVQKLEDDCLGRAVLARSFAEQTLTLDSTEGVVVGVLGPWGSGKTSFINLARTHLESNAAEGLTTTSERGRNPRLKVQIDCLIEAGGDRSDLVQALIRRLFPAACRHIGNTHYGAEWKSQWLQERRVAHEDILRFYLERFVSAGLKIFIDVEHVWQVLADQSALDSYLRALDPTRRQDVIASLEMLEQDFAPEHVVPGSIVLLNLAPDLPDQRQGLLELEPQMTVGRVVYRLVRVLKEPNAIEAAVKEILPQLTSLTAKKQLIDMIGYREGLGHKLISEKAAQEFEELWRKEACSTTGERLAEERDLLRILLRVKRDADGQEPALDISNLPSVTLALLRSARSDTRSQSLGSRAVRRSPRLVWDGLIEVYGSEETLKTRITELRATQPEGGTELLELAEKYSEGWRPNDSDD